LIELADAINQDFSSAIGLCIIRYINRDQVMFAII